MAAENSSEINEILLQSFSLHHTKVVVSFAGVADVLSVKQSTKTLHCICVKSGHLLKEPRAASERLDATLRRLTLVGPSTYLIAGSHVTTACD